MNAEKPSAWTGLERVESDIKGALRRAVLAPTSGSLAMDLFRIRPLIQSPWIAFSVSDPFRVLIGARRCVSLGQVTYGECSLLTSILSRPGERNVIPKACHFDEEGRAGRVHGFHHNQGLYALSRRATKSIAPKGKTLTPRPRRVRYRCR